MGAAGTGSEELTDHSLQFLSTTGFIGGTETLKAQKIVDNESDFKIGMLNAIYKHQDFYVSYLMDVLREVYEQGSKIGNRELLIQLKKVRRDAGISDETASDTGKFENLNHLRDIRHFVHLILFFMSCCRNVLRYRQRRKLQIFPLFSLTVVTHNYDSLSVKMLNESPKRLNKPKIGLKEGENVKVEIEVPDRLYRILEQCGDAKVILQEWFLSGVEARIDTLKIPVEEMLKEAGLNRIKSSAGA